MTEKNVIRLSGRAEPVIRITVAPRVVVVPVRVQVAEPHSCVRRVIPVPRAPKRRVVTAAVGVQVGLLLITQFSHLFT